MTLAILTNVVTILLCLAVVVQTMRMMRNLRRVKDGALTQVVGALEKATEEARIVLREMQGTLRDCAEYTRLVSQAQGLRDELSDMIGIADATAERIVETVGLARALRAEEMLDTGETQERPPEPAEPLEPATKPAPPRRGGRARREGAAA